MNLFSEENTCLYTNVALLLTMLDELGDDEEAGPGGGIFDEDPASGPGADSKGPQ